MDEWIKSMVMIVILCIDNLLMVLFGYAMGRKRND